MKFFSKNRKRKNKNMSSPQKSTNSGQGIRHEISGLLLIGLGILLILALISYHQSDPVGFLDENNFYKVQNWLGIFGSTVAAPVFQWTFGYPILVLPLLVIIYGFYLMLKKPLRKLLRPSILLLAWALLFSIILAVPEAFRTFGNFQTFYPSGFIGGICAAYLVKIFGKIGAIFILFLTILIIGIITFRLKFSVVPLGVSRLLSHTFTLLSKLLNSGKNKILKLIHRSNLPGTASAGLSRKKSEQEATIDPYFQPSLPSEEEISSDHKKSAIEVITRMKSEEKFSQEFEEKRVKQDEKSEIIPEIEISEDPTSSPLGFEIQEAHHEKELDYDSLVRDSLAKYQFPSSELLTEEVISDYHLSDDELTMNAQLLEETLAQFGVRAVVNRVVEGPVITLYEVKPDRGVKISQIVGLADDLALAMRAKGIRMIAPIPGKAAIGIEIPNKEPSTVYFRSIVRSETFINFDGRLPIGIGKTISGEVLCADLTKMPHLLIAGATGSGKSVGINTIIGSLLYRIPPSDLKFVMIDPKKLELSIYAKLKDHYLATCSDLDEIVVTHPQNAIMILRSVVNEMESRYDKLAALGVREISHFNRKIDEYKKNGETSEEFRRLPYLVVVIDELADLILSATREVEEPITRLAQMARAVGIHLIMATQRPSVDILTGLIKANFPARIAYQVATRPDSKVILDMYGAEKLIGNGDMLFMPPGKVKPLRLQNPLITTEEVERIIKHIRKQPKFPPYELKLFQNREKGTATSKMFERDELFEEAKNTIIRYQQGSVSLLQRKLKIGYARAARIIDELEEAGVVGPPVQEGKAREVLVSSYTTDTSDRGENE